MKILESNAKFIIITILIFFQKKELLLNTWFHLVVRYDATGEIDIF